MGQIIGSSSFSKVVLQLTDDGTQTGSPDLVVNGGTPQKFSVASPSTNDIFVDRLRFVFSLSNSFTFDGSTFGNGGGVLDNGILVSFISDAGTSSKDAFTIKCNEEFLKLDDNTLLSTNGGSVLSCTLPLEGSVVLRAGTSDELAVTIRDNLTLNSRRIEHLSATLFGRESK